MPDGLLLIDKAPGWTSHDVAAKCRYLLRERRTGHGGTLDPMATGLLVVFAGRATRAVPYLPGDKTYRAKMRFGIETDTQDIWGVKTAESPRVPSEDELREVLPRFTGTVMQTPPMVSALKIGGKKLYELARRGIEVERAPRPVTVHSLELTGSEEGDFCLEVSCSAGTYVRTLIHDIGRALGSCAAMTALRRTGSGPFAVEDACPVEDASPERLIPVDRLFAGYPAVTVPTGYEKTVRNGGDFPREGFEDGAFVRVYGPDGGFLMLGRARDGRIFTEKSFFEVP